MLPHNDCVLPERLAKRFRTTGELCHNAFATEFRDLESSENLRERNPRFVLTIPEMLIPSNEVIGWHDPSMRILAQRLKRLISLSNTDSQIVIPAESEGLLVAEADAKAKGLQKLCRVVRACH